MMTSVTDISRPTIILQAALKCFLNDGYEHTSIEDIRLESGASVGSIYHHFGSKVRIASHLYIEGHKNKHQYIAKQLANVKTAETILKGLVTGYTDWTKENQDWAKFLLTFQPSAMPEDLANHESDLRQQFINSLLTTISPYINNGEIRQITSELYVPIIFGPVINLSQNCLAQNALHTLDKHSQHLAEAAWQALR